MLENAFIGRPEKPSEADLATALGPAKKLWDRLQAALSDRHEVNVLEWKSYSRKAGWALRLKRKERAILYLSPCRGRFLASFALGEGAVKAARRSGLPKIVIRTIDGARRYAEGTAVRLEVKKPADIEAVILLAEIKLEN